MNVLKSLPPRIRGFSVCKCEPDGDYYTIVLNDTLSREMQEKAYLHEQYHIEADHFHDDRPLEIKEEEARKEGK